MDIFLYDGWMHACVGECAGRKGRWMDGRKEGDGVFSYLSIYLVMRSIF